MSVNAIEMAARVVGKVRDMGEAFERQEPRYEGFDVPFSTTSVGQFHGGIADNVVPRDAEFRYEFRNLPTADAAGHAGRGGGPCAGAGAGHEAGVARGRVFIRDDLRSAELPGVGPAICDPPGAAPERARRAPRWWRLVPRPACSSSPAFPRWCAGPAASTRPTSPTSM
jgi:metal-dependent amidase/aminoacylase/carboxypeptidase family protein